MTAATDKIERTRVKACIGLSLSFSDSVQHHFD